MLEHKIINHLLDGIKECDFNYEQPFFIHRQRPDFFDNWMNIKKICALISSSVFNPREIAINYQEQSISTSSICSKGKVNRNQLIEHLACGARLTFKNLEHHSMSIGRYLSELTSELNKTLTTKLCICKHAYNIKEKAYENQIISLQLEGTRNIITKDGSVAKKLEAGDTFYLPKNTKISFDTSGLSMHLNIYLIDKIQTKEHDKIDIDELLTRLEVAKLIQ